MTWIVLLSGSRRFCELHEPFTRRTNVIEAERADNRSECNQSLHQVLLDKGLHLFASKLHNQKKYGIMINNKANTDLLLRYLLCLIRSLYAE